VTNTSLQRWMIHGIRVYIVWSCSKGVCSIGNIINVVCVVVGDSIWIVVAIGLTWGCLLRTYYQNFIHERNIGNCKPKCFNSGQTFLISKSWNLKNRTKIWWGKIKLLIFLLKVKSKIWLFWNFSYFKKHLMKRSGEYGRLYISRPNIMGVGPRPQLV